MDIDFSLVLVILVFVTGAVSLLDALFLYPRRKRALNSYEEQAGEKVDATVVENLQREPVWVEYPKSFFPVLLIVLVLRSFLVEPFTIPSGSMLPTLEVGDYILVNKYHYGLRLPVIGTKVMALNEPDRGDIMVFKYPENPRINYIKRVIGLPGDVIRYQNNVLSVNGAEVDRKLVAKLSNPPRKVYVEDLERVRPEVESEAILQHELWTKVGTGIFSGEWVVPEGHFFMLGDNRDNSRDSRVWGFVPDKYIVGKAFAIWMHKPGFVLPSFSRNGFIQ